MASPYFVYGSDGPGPGHPTQTGALGLQSDDLPNIALSTLLYSWDIMAIKLPDGQQGNHPHYQGHWVVKVIDIDESARLSRLRAMDAKYRSLMDEDIEGYRELPTDGDLS